MSRDRNHSTQVPSRKPWCVQAKQLLDKVVAAAPQHGSALRLRATVEANSGGDAERHGSCSGAPPVRSPTPLPPCRHDGQAST